MREREGADIWIVGIGNFSCARWLSSAFLEGSGEAWIAGYWTGLNELSNTDHMVGHAVDNAGIYGEVKKVCTEHPSMQLPEATYQVYDMIAAQHK